MHITAHPAKLTDIPALNELITLSVRWLSIGHYTPIQIESALKYVFGVDTRLVLDGTYYVAEIDGVIVGCGGWSKRNTLYGGDQHKGIADPLVDPAHDAARIRAFFIHPNYARRGVGTHIINLCETEAKANGFSTFELGATLPGVPLYKAMGYHEIEHADAYLPDGVVLEIIKMRKG